MTLSTITVSLVGCASGSHSGQSASPTSTTPAGWPPTLNDFSVVWSAEPDIAVTTWPAVAVRAYAESYLLASITGEDKFLYPGFKQAVDADKPIDNPTGTRFLWPKTDRRTENPWVGTEYDHILSIATSGRDVTVVVCEYMFGTAQARGHGYTPNIGQPPPDSGIEPMRITMTAPATTGPQLPAQQGPARAPSADVFGGWRITGHQGGYFAEYGLAAEWPDLARDTDACRAKAPPHPDLVRGGEYPRSNFPTQPPAPGWPAPSPAS
ncbi:MULTISPECIES: hypothetical protein [unclassified Mycobacterium]|uniref:hypothetical protein n=1 Tax=unclassified Mycobacterium TaxID=2642494 RepID=UPI001E554E4A|nr:MULTISPECIES: hypothetical protein [unclassified Mycobacterium]